MENIYINWPDKAWHLSKHNLTVLCVYIKLLLLLRCEYTRTVPVRDDYDMSCTAIFLHTEQNSNWLFSCMLWTL